MSFSAFIWQRKLTCHPALRCMLLVNSCSMRLLRHCRSTRSSIRTSLGRSLHGGVVGYASLLLFLLMTPEAFCCVGRNSAWEVFSWKGRGLLMRNSWLLVPKRKKWRDGLSSALAAVRHFDCFEVLDNIQKFEERVYGSGVLSRVSLSVGFARFESPEETCRTQLSACDKFRRHIGPTARKVMLVVRPEPFPGLLSPPPRPHRVCLSTCRDFAFQFLSETNMDRQMFTLEDKGPSVLWKAWTLGLVALLLLQIMFAPSGWLPQRLDHKKVLLLYQRLAHAVLPSRLRRRVPISEWTLPHLSATLEHKCFEENETRKCTKASHSCLRQIASFVRMPVRKTYRLMRRALYHLVDCVWLGFSFQNLSTAPTEMTECYRNLLHAFSCVRCGCNKPSSVIRILLFDPEEIVEIQKVLHSRRVAIRFFM